MRIGKVMLISVLVLLLLSACEKSNVNASPEAPTESIGEKSNESEDNPEKMRIKDSFNQIEYESRKNDAVDRIELSAKWVVGHFNLDPDNPYTEGVAICLITLLKADTEMCFEESGTNIPITIRIDRVLVSNGYFNLKSGDIVETFNPTAWMKKGDSYVVWTPEGQIPIAVEGAQYIAQVGKLTDEDIKQLPLPARYRTESFTIPIVDESIITREEIYNIMDLPDDVQKCSEELIEMFIR